MNVPLPVWLALAGELLLMLLIYLTVCWRHPTVVCVSCLDFPPYRTYCPECRGTGKQIRWGARLLGRK